jgi:DNA gyrase subunit A
VSVVRTTVRADIGAITSTGRMLRISVVDLPALPRSASSPSLAGAAPVSEFITLEADEELVGLGTFDTEGPGPVLGTREGIVKRVVPDYPANRDEFEVIGLKDDDKVVGAIQLESEDWELVFITSDAQLLRFDAAAVRPQGRPAGGMAGIRLSEGAHVVWFGAVDASRPSVVVTIAGSSSELPGTQTGAAKVSDFADFPAKGRATGGVRSHRFLKGEDTLLLGWAGPVPVRAASSAGTPVELPSELGRRDGSGEKLETAIAVVGCPIVPSSPATADRTADELSGKSGDEADQPRPE